MIIFLLYTAYTSLYSITHWPIIQEVRHSMTAPYSSISILFLIINIFIYIHLILLNVVLKGFVYKIYKTILLLAYNIIK